MNQGLTTDTTTEAATPADRSCRALLPLSGQTSSPLRTAPRPAAFLAHLIAVKEKHPQTRERRRAEPAEAIRAYIGILSMKL